MGHGPAEPISQLPAWGTVWLKGRTGVGVGPYSTVLSPAVSVHQAIVMVLVSASGFSMMGPRLIVTPPARPAITSPAATRRRVFARIKQSPSRGRDPAWTDVRRWKAGARPYTSDRRRGKEKRAPGGMRA